MITVRTVLVWMGTFICIGTVFDVYTFFELEKSSPLHEVHRELMLVWSYVHELEPLLKPHDENVWLLLAHASYIRWYCARQQSVISTGILEDIITAFTYLKTICQELASRMYQHEALRCAYDYLCVTSDFFEYLIEQRMIHQKKTVW